MCNPVSIPRQLTKTRLRVLAWTDHFFGADYLEPVHLSGDGGQDIHMTFTRDRTELATVDAVWFHGPSIEELPLRTEKRQPWVLMSMESEVNYPSLASPIVRKWFDLLMTYRLDADIPCIYPNWHQYGDFLQPPPVHSAASSDVLAAYIASNPVKYRDEYVKGLMRFMPVASFGSCLNNRSPDDFVKGGWSRGAWESILSVLPQYKFYLALENSRTTDYVTERIFHALVCGTVPIYLGAENVRKFMPDDDAVIVASDFSGPEALADYLKLLDRDSGAYSKHLAWKSRGLSPQFRKLVDLGSTNPMHRLAVKLAHGCERNCDCGGRQRLENEARL